MPSYIELEKNLNEQLPNASDNSKLIFAVSSSGLIILKDVNGNNAAISESYALNAASSSYAASASYLIGYVTSISSSWASSSLSASYVPNLYPTNLTGYTLTSSFNNYTSSNDAKINSLVSYTSSYLTTSSYPHITDVGFVGINNPTPSTALDVVGYIHTDVGYSIGGNTVIDNNGAYFNGNSVPLYTLDVNGDINFTSNLLNNGSIYVPDNAVSASYVPNLYPTNLTGYTLTSSFNNYTSSNDSKVNSLINHTSSYLTTSSVISSSISSSWASSSLSASYITASNVSGLATTLINTSSYSLVSNYATYVSQSNMIGTSSVYAQSYILTGSYSKIITSSYTLAATENGKLLIVNSGSVATLTVPSTLPQGFACSMFQSGSGKVVVSGSGVNIRNRAGLSSSYAQYSVISLLQLDASSYLLAGDVG